MTIASRKSIGLVVLILLALVAACGWSVSSGVVGCRDAVDRPERRC